MALTRLGLNQSINLATNVTGTLATGNGGTGATSFTSGKLLQIVEEERSSSAYSTSSSYSDIFSLAITPSSTSSKIYAIVSIAYNLYQNGSTKHSSGDFKLLFSVGGSDTTLARNTVQDTSDYSSDSTDQANSTHTFACLFSPNTTSAVTVKVQQKASNGRIGALGTNGGENASMMQLMEIGA